MNAEIEEREDDMSKEILEKIEKLLPNLATKDDIAGIKDELKTLNTAIIGDMTTTGIKNQVAKINNTVSYIKDNNVTKLDIKGK